MTDFTKRPAPTEHHEYYAQYVAQVPPGDLLDLLSAQSERVAALTERVTPELSVHRYAEGKWSVAEVVQHVIDTERVMGYRALSFARGDRSPLPGFDQDLWVTASRADERTIDAMVGEFVALRNAGIAFLRSCDDATLDRSGVMWERDMSVRSIAFLIYGHAAHHLDVLDTRYLG